MAKTPDKDEVQLASLTKSLLAMPHKVREESKIGKGKGRVKRKYSSRKGKKFY